MFLTGHRPAGRVNVKIQQSYVPVLLFEVPVRVYACIKSPLISDLTLHSHRKETSDPIIQSKSDEYGNEYLVMTNIPVSSKDHNRFRTMKYLFYRQYFVRTRDPVWNRWIEGPDAPTETFSSTCKVKEKRKIKLFSFKKILFFVAEDPNRNYEPALDYSSGDDRVRWIGGLLFKIVADEHRH